MKLLCNLFGHRPRPWYNLDCHLKIGPPYYDGIQRAHRDLYAECKWCNEKYLFGKVIDPLLAGDNNVNAEES